MKKLYICFLIGAAVLVSCKKKDKEEQTPAPDTKKAVAENYAAIVYATYDDALTAAKNLKTKAQALIDAPTEVNLQLAKEAYIAARFPYEQSESFRFYGGPIDDVEGNINAWPLDESYIDYTQADLSSAIINGGIINDAATYPTISKQTLIDANAVGGSTNVSCGYHAIEFLLWGQDFYSDGPGRRPASDYITGAGGTNSNQDRRGQYLMACIDQLIDDLQYAADGWKPGVQNYRAAFVSNSQAAIGLIMTGIAKFANGELSDERMAAALLSHGQEDEHSCFSDQTHNDILLGQKSIVNVYTGNYLRTDGTTLISGMSVKDLLSSANASLGTTVQTKITETSAAAQAIADNAPFDQEILSGNTAGNTLVQTCIGDLRNEGTYFVDVALSLGSVISLGE